MPLEALVWVSRDRELVCTGGSLAGAAWGVRTESGCNITLEGVTITGFATAVYAASGSKYTLTDCTIKLQETNAAAAVPSLAQRPSACVLADWGAQVQLMGCKLLTHLPHQRAAFVRKGASLLMGSSQVQVLCQEEAEAAAAGSDGRPAAAPSQQYPSFTVEGTLIMTEVKATISPDVQLVVGVTPTGTLRASRSEFYGGMQSVHVTGGTANLTDTQLKPAESPHTAAEGGADTGAVVVACGGQLTAELCEIWFQSPWFWGPMPTTPRGTATILRALDGSFASLEDCFLQGGTAGLIHARGGSRMELRRCSWSTSVNMEGLWSKLLADEGSCIAIHSSTLRGLRVHAEGRSDVEAFDSTIFSGSVEQPCVGVCSGSFKAERSHLCLDDISPGTTEAAMWNALTATAKGHVSLSDCKITNNVSQRSSIYSFRSLHKRPCIVLGSKSHAELARCKLGSTVVCMRGRATLQLEHTPLCRDGLVLIAAPPFKLHVHGRASQGSLLLSSFSGPVWRSWLPAGSGNGTLYDLSLMAQQQQEAQQQAAAAVAAAVAGQISPGEAAAAIGRMLRSRGYQEVLGLHGGAAGAAAEDGGSAGDVEQHGQAGGAGGAPQLMEPPYHILLLEDAEGGLRQVVSLQLPAAALQALREAGAGMVPANAGPRGCAQCGAQCAELQQCTECGIMHYCDDGCRDAHWPLHVPLCPTAPRSSTPQPPGETPAPAAGATSAASTAPSRSCAQCGAAAGPGGKSLRVCSGCKGAYYCSGQCQNAHWKRHKAACKAQQVPAVVPPPSRPARVAGEPAGSAGASGSQG